MESDSSPPSISFSKSKQSLAASSTSSIIPISSYHLDDDCINGSLKQQQAQLRAQLTGLGPSDPPAIANPSVKRLSCQIIFYTQFTIVSILSIFLITRAIQHHFHPEKWLPPILTAVMAAGFSAFAWQWLTMHRPTWILKAAFGLSPLLTCSVGFMFFHVRSEASHLLGISSICFAVCQVLYGCWVFPKLPYAACVIEESTEHVPPNVPRLVQLTVLGAMTYSSFLVCGIGVATVTSDTVYVGVILLSLTWTMLVAANAVQVLVARLKYIHFTYGVQMGLVAIVIDMVRHMMGTITFGSAIIPIFGLIRGPAQVITSLTCNNGGTHLSGVSAVLRKRASWWGLVHVGVQNMDFIHASTHTWEHFHDADMDMLIETDLTEVLCFFCGLTGGSVASLVSGFMAMPFHRAYAIELSLYASLIGYFMCRISMAWLQASVAAYYVAYADNTESPRLNSLVPSRIDELKMHQPLLS